jgi:hypothetical protein
MFAHVAGTGSIWGKKDEEIFYLLSQQDSFLNVYRSWFFWPFVNKIRIVMSAIVLLLLYIVSLILVDGFLPVLVFMILYMTISWLIVDTIYYRIERSAPNWLMKLCHYLIPY